MLFNAEQSVRSIVLNVIGSDADLVDATRLQDLGVDSLNIVEIGIKIEKEFGVNISDAELDEIDTFKDLVDITASKLTSR
ncbi:acyl carrier protein [Streptomyces sp. NPDC015492]|uniref:acyl carrier protein n=1 Tax=Streptomyces sp. NPDC015492 TaxID=3364958 RepID=UPI0036F8E794